MKDYNFMISDNSLHKRRFRKKKEGGGGGVCALRVVETFWLVVIWLISLQDVDRFLILPTSPI